ncbi:MAG: DUF2344 domain-containing protein, partial [Clostridia bacterium]|nr:DUF2344 domain-containing protein [Clostridia bacterium]
MLCLRYAKQGVYSLQKRRQQLMEQITKYTLRVFWQKKGNAKYTSHLDTQRTVTRALVRSGLPLYYT